jgi:diketogulonate reductase-like aldo/keto reductase
MDKNLPLVDGYDIPVLGLRAFRSDSEEATINIVRKFLKLTDNQSMRNFEISELFGNGQIVLNAIRESGLKREDAFFSFKVWSKERSGSDIITSVIESLTLTNLTYFDLILIHAPIDSKHKFEQWTALETLKDQGYVRSIGVSNYSEVQLVELMKFCHIQPSVLEVSNSII